MKSQDKSLIIAFVQGVEWWANEVINYQNDYDKIQVDRAKWLLKNYKEE